MRRVVVSVLFGGTVGCHYGYVYDASDGLGEDSVTVTLVEGTCSGSGCTSRTSGSDVTSSSGFYVFDAYGDIEGASNTMYLFPQTGSESIRLRYSKSGFRSLFLYHRSDWQTVESGGSTYYYSLLPNLYLCRTTDIDSDGDGLCNAAEQRYLTDPFDADTDDDGFSDGAEILGLDGIDLRFYGANPRRKDIFLEIDFYPGLRPADEALDLVVASFAAAPVSNPDGSTGISLHVVLDDQIASADADLDLSPVWTDFDVIRSRYFDSSRERIFHYCLFAHRYDGGSSSGRSRGIPGRDLLVTLGTWSPSGGTVLQQAGTLMHELGHNLGLQHGGQDGRNYKPHYFSVMSYLYQVEGLTRGGTTGVIDYSRIRVNTVNESNLVETTAFSPASGYTSTTLATYSVRVRRSTGANVWLTGNANANLDMNGDGRISSSPMSFDLDGDGDALDVFPTSQNDWDNLVFDGAGTIGNAGIGASSPFALRTLSYRVPPAAVEPCLTPDRL